MHRDLKTENILIKVDTNGTKLVKLIDWGIAAKIEEGGNLTQMIGTTHYMAPEVFLKHYDEKVDVWAVGVLIYEIVLNIKLMGSCVERCLSLAARIGTSSARSRKMIRPSSSRSGTRCPSNARISLNRYCARTRRKGRRQPRLFSILGCSVTSMTTPRVRFSVIASSAYRSSKPRVLFSRLCLIT